MAHKTKVVFVLGTTGAGKTKLSIDLAIRFHGEIINSDKIQVYQGMDIATNKVPMAEQRGIPHHLLGHIADPEVDYTSEDFAQETLLTLDKIIKAGNVPIIVGGSNSYIMNLVENPTYSFKERFEPFFLWISSNLPVLHDYVAKRIDVMVANGLVEELQAFCVPGVDYSRGIYRSIGAPEFDRYFREGPNLDKENKERLLQECIQEMKANTYELTLNQLTKLGRMRDELGWRMHRVDSTSVFVKSGKEAQAEWVENVATPAFQLVEDFLHPSVDDDNKGANGALTSQLKMLDQGTAAVDMDHETYSKVAHHHRGLIRVCFAKLKIAYKLTFSLLKLKFLALFGK